MLTLVRKPVAFAFALGLNVVTAQVLRADLGVPLSPTAPVRSNGANDSGRDFMPALATDGHGHWVAVWSANHDTGDGSGTDDDLYVARSLDAGAHWSNPVILNANAATPNAGDYDAAIATDGQGHWVVVWSSDDSLGNTIGGDYDILVARSVDNGANWSIPVPLNSNAASDSGSDFNPSIATDRQGHWLVAWQTEGLFGADSDIATARSIDNGATWSAPIPAKTTAATDGTSVDYEPSVATDGQGHWLVAWWSGDSLGGTIGDDFDILVSRSGDNGASWSDVIPLNATAASDTLTDSKPRLASDGHGQWVAVWVTADVLAARSIDNGANWSIPAPVYTSPANVRAYNPSIVTDGVGNWAAIWPTVKTIPPGYFEDTQILLARSIDGANWSSAASPPGDVGDDAEFDADTSIATDGHGNWVALWSSYGGLGGSIGGDLEVLTTRFGLPDCNENLIGDPTETAFLLAPDLNFNSIPDTCELPLLPLPTTTSTACGVGLCGAGATMFGPTLLVGIMLLSRSKPRRA